MSVSAEQIQAAIADVGLLIKSRHERAEGEVYIVTTPTPGPATTIAIREAEKADPFIVFGRIQNAARVLRADD
jgi:hypothetical protein